MTEKGIIGVGLAGVSIGYRQMNGYTQIFEHHNVRGGYSWVYSGRHVVQFLSHHDKSCFPLIS